MTPDHSPAPQADAPTTSEALIDATEVARAGEAAADRAYLDGHVGLAAWFRRLAAGLWAKIRAAAADASKETAAQLRAAAGELAAIFARSMVSQAFDVAGFPRRA